DVLPGVERRRVPEQRHEGERQGLWSAAKQGGVAFSHPDLHAEAASSTRPRHELLPPSLCCVCRRPLNRENLICRGNMLRVTGFGSDSGALRPTCLDCGVLIGSVGPASLPPNSGAPDALNLPLQFDATSLVRALVASGARYAGIVLSDPNT